MRKVIDANSLQSERLKKYLNKNTKNMAVLTDYAAMEAYKGSTLKSIFKSMQILTKYPDQVIILKGTQTVCDLNGKGKGLQKRLIDEKQTKEFEKYYLNLKVAEGGNSKFEKMLLNHGVAANGHMDNILKDSEKIIISMRNIAKGYTKSELKMLRKGESFTDEMIDKIITGIIYLAAFMFVDHPKYNKLPNYNELPNKFIFRYSLAMYLLGINWIADGGLNNLKPEKMRNDMVDMNYVAYATYFDGLMSNDNKAMQIYSVAMDFLNYFNKHNNEN